MEDDIFTLARNRGAVSAVSDRAVFSPEPRQNLTSFALFVRVRCRMCLAAVFRLQ